MIPPEAVNVEDIADTALPTPAATQADQCRHRLAQRLINTYCYVTEPEPDAVERLTRSAPSLYHTPRSDLVEFECDVYGEPVSRLSLDEIDALVYGG